jgi:hypothetical protein
VEHCSGMQVAPAQRDGEVRGGVGSGEIVEPGVVGKTFGIPAEPGLPCLLGAFLSCSSRERPYGPKSALTYTDLTSKLFASRGTTAAGSPRRTLSPWPPASRNSPSSTYSAAVSHARRARPAEVRSVGSSTKSGSTASPSSIAERNAGLSTSRKSRRTHQIEGRSSELIV